MEATREDEKKVASRGIERVENLCLTGSFETRISRGATETRHRPGARNEVRLGYTAIETGDEIFTQTGRS